MDPVTKQVGYYAITFTPSDKSVEAHYLTAPETGSRVVYDTEEKAHTVYVQLHMQETVMNWIAANAKPA